MSTKLTSLSLTAVLMGGTAFADVPNVAVDIAPVHSLVARVMQGVGEPSLVIQQGASPHEHSLRPSEATALQDADLVFWIGEDLTPWMADAVETLAENADVTELLEADGITLLDFREGALFEAHEHDDHGDEEHDEHDHDDHGDEDHDEHEHDDHGDEDHDEHEHDDHGDDDHDEHEHDDHGDDEHEHDDHGDEDHDEHEHDDHGDEDHADHDGHDHGDHDPHAWLLPKNASVWLNVIAAELSAADPENAGTYFANAAAARAEMEALVTEVNAILDPVRGGRFIVFHDAYQYFETGFDLPASGAISLGDASDPSPARLSEVQGRISAEGISCILTEPQFNAGLAEAVSQGLEVTTGVIDPLGTSLELGPTLYPQLIRDMATTLAECL